MKREDTMKALDLKIEEENKNPFNLLPKEIIVNIFNKISEAKSLCNCYLVSKIFSSLVLETNTVSFEIPSWVRAHRPEPPPASAEKITPLDISTLGPSTSSTIKFLMKFSHINSITIYLSFSENPTSEELRVVKWSCDESGFIFMSAKIFDGTNYSSITFENEDVSTMIHMMQEHYMTNVHCRVNLISFFIHGNFPNLKNILVLDAMKEGRIFLNEDGIDEMKDYTAPLNDDEDDLVIKIWHVPLLRLPLTGRVMKVTVCAVIDIGFDDFSKMCEDGFEEEEYRELAMIMVKKTPCFVSSCKDVFGRE